MPGKTLINRIVLLALIMVSSLAIAQKHDTYKIWTTLTNGEKLSGYLGSAHSDELVLLNKSGRDTLRVISYKSIDLLAVRKKGAVGRGVLIGGGVGLALGGLVGYASAEPGYWQMESAYAGMVLGAPAGALIGAGFGRKKKKYLITGSLQAYRAFLEDLNGK